MGWYFFIHNHYSKSKKPCKERICERTLTKSAVCPSLRFLIILKLPEKACAFPETVIEYTQQPARSTKRRRNRKGSFRMNENIHILAVDDEQDIREIVRILLESKGYSVDCAANGAEAIGYVKAHPEVDLIILDIMMPGLSGVEACREIRRFSAAPILFLTAKTMESDKDEAYTSGGDDYLGKPFSQAELLMKVNSLLRRYRVYQGKPQKQQEKTLVLCPEKGYVLHRGEVVPLTNKEIDILQFFLDHPGEVLDARRLYEGVWKEKYLPSATNTVMVHILNLRKKLEADYTDPQLIRTVWGKGYQLDET